MCTYIYVWVHVCVHACVHVCMYVCVCRYAAFLSKLLPPTGHVLLDSVRDDCFYCFLLPLSVLPTSLILYLNWLSMRIFESS
jgi:hypothetical protein